MRPEFRARNERVEIAHHLAAIAHAEGESVGAIEERQEFRARPFVEEDALRPAFAGAGHVAVAEAATGGDADEIAQRNAAAENIRHVYIDRAETGAGESRGHFDLAVHALLAQNRDGWTRFQFGDRGPRLSHVK